MSHTATLGKFTAILLSLALSLPMGVTAFADGKSMPPAAYAAKSALLMEESTGQILFEQNSNERLAPASLTKIMGLILIMEAIDSGKLALDQTLTCSEYAKTMGGSEIWLKAGEEMTVDDLLKGLFVASANDVSVVFAEALASTEEGFVNQMNQRAAKMGLKNTHFLNCTGFDEEGHYTSAADVAVMARELLKNSLVKKYSSIWMDTLRGGKTELVNTNRLIRFYRGATGLKTGTTDAAGHCLCATATRDGLSLISVVMGGKTSDIRFEESKKLLDFGFTNYGIFTPEPMSSEILPVKVLRGEEKEILPDSGSLPGAVVKIEDIPKIEQKLELSPSVEAPVEKGQQLGKILLLVEGKEIASYPILSGIDVRRLTFFRSLRLVAIGFLTVN